MKPRKSIVVARRLRRDMTDAERAVWQRLRAGQLNGHKFRRQHPLAGYVVDFVCIESRLLIEIDGGQHAGQVKSDQLRTDQLEKLGYTVIRFWNSDVLTQTDAVLTAILQALDAAQPPSPQPLSRRRERG